MKIIDIDFKDNGKKYFCKDINEIFEVEEGDLIAATRSFSMAELLELDFEEVKEASFNNPYKQVGCGEKYHCIYGFMIHANADRNHEIDNKLFSTANYFNNKEYAKYVAFKETLMRRMDRFAWENNAETINWNYYYKKYYIAFDNKYNGLTINWSCSYQSNDIYFTSIEIAEKAIEEFKDDLIKLYTWRFDV